jgi:hypothetical protein
MRPVLGGSSYASQDRLVATFGLGRRHGGTLEVRWPAGTRNRLYDVASFERIVFPEIPCSFQAEWTTLAQYVACIDTALGELSARGVLSPQERARFHASALRAFHSFEEGGNHER